MSSIIDNNQNVSEFLNLLSARLKHKYKENVIIINKIDQIKDKFILLPKQINIDTLDKICKKFYFDFDMEKSTDINLGYTEDEKNKIRTMIIGILYEFIKCAKM